MTEVKCWRGSSSRCVRPVDQQRFNCLCSSRSSGSCVFFFLWYFGCNYYTPLYYLLLLSTRLSVLPVEPATNKEHTQLLASPPPRRGGGGRSSTQSPNPCVCNPRARARLSICYLAETIQKKRRQVNVVNNKKRTDLHSRSGCSSPSHHFRRS